MRKTRTAALAIAAMLAAGCQLLDGDEAPALDEEEAARVHTVLDENHELTVEILDVQYRIVIDCMEAAGHTVHDRYQEVMWNYQRQSLPRREDRFTPWLIDRDIAADWGFGVWASTLEMYGSEEHTAFEALNDEGFDSFAEVDNAAFDALGDQEKFDWYAAHYGQERALAEHGWLLGAADPGGDTDMLVPASEPGGCVGEMIEALGLTAEYVPRPDLGEDAGTWATFPQAPGVAALVAGELDAELRDARERDEAFLDCLEEAGWGQWDFNDHGHLNVWYFLDQAYSDLPSAPADFMTDGAPEPPADVPADAESRRDWEAGFALDVHDCVDETGFAEDAERAWNDVYGAHFLGLEAESHAWQEEMRSLIARAQELLAG